MIKGELEYLEKNVLEKGLPCEKALNFKSRAQLENVLVSCGAARGGGEG